MGFARVGSNPTVVDLFLFGVRGDSRSGPSGAMDSASDFGSGGWGFESPQGLITHNFFFLFVAPWARRIVTRKPATQQARPVCVACVHQPAQVWFFCPFALHEESGASLAEWLRRWL